MRDLGTLRERIEQAQQRMRVVQTARERESEALADMWSQIRTRFADQETELDGYRARVSTLEDAHEELLKLVETLLGAIEGNLSRVQDETVPHIASAAEQLLRDGTIGPERAPTTVDAVPPVQPRSDFVRRPAQRTSIAPTSQDDADQGAEPSPSPGIRDLIARVHRAVNTEEQKQTGPSSELEKELQEIENLRSELQGLKRRISNQ
jgi:chromosome segregation ATPase